MFSNARRRVDHQSAGCWKHTAIVGERSCERCGARCCEHCWLEAPPGDVCIGCALELAGVRAPRPRRLVATSPPAPWARASWEDSAHLIDLAPAYRPRRPEPVPRQLFVHAA